MNKVLHFDIMALKGLKQLQNINILAQREKETEREEEIERERSYKPENIIVYKSL